MPSQIQTDQIQTDLNTYLVAKGAIADGQNWQVQSGGRSNFVWRLVESNLICKLYNTADINNPFYPNDPAAEWACLTALHKTATTPRPKMAMQTPFGAVLLYHYVAGQSWQSDTAPVAHLIEQIHATPAPPEVKIAPTPERMMHDTQQILHDISCDKNCKTDCGLRGFIPLLDTCPLYKSIANPVLTHTDIVAGNLICDKTSPKTQLCLIDWQCPALGDGAVDLASFISPAMQTLYRGTPLSADETARFLTTFTDRDLVARYHQLAVLYHWRIAVYCHWRVVKHGFSDYAVARDAEIAHLQAITA